MGKSPGETGRELGCTVASRHAPLLRGYQLRESDDFDSGFIIYSLELGSWKGAANNEMVDSVLKRETFRIAQIYVPVKRRGTVSADLVGEIAESILEIGQQTPILVRPDGDRYVLVEGLHRLEACKALGEETIVGFLVQAHLSTETVKPSSETDLEVARQKTERLRQLRLAKEAAERPTASTAKEIESRSTSDERGGKRLVARRSKPISLVDWLSKRGHDGFSS